MLKAATAKIIALNLITTAIGNNHFNHSHFLSLFLFPVLYQTFSPRQSPLPGESNQTVGMRKGKRKGLTGILLVNVLLCSTLEVIG